MSASSQTDAVRALAEPVVRAAGLVLEGVSVTPAGRRRVLRVVVDLPAEHTGGVPMDSVATASQQLSAALDGSTVMGGAPYVLEVSSPGVDRPLTEPRHWSRARGRLVTVTLAAGGQVSGRLTGVDAAGVELAGDRALPWDEIARGRVEIEFGHHDGDAPEAAADEEPADGEPADGEPADEEPGELDDEVAGEDAGGQEV